MQLVFDTLEARGIRQTWLAEQLGVKAWTVTRWKTGHTPVPDHIVRRSCELLGLPYETVCRVGMFQSGNSVETPEAVPA